MEKASKYEEIERVKQHINKMFPHVKSVEVKVEEIPKKGTRSLIQVKAPHKKKLVALKVDRDIKTSLEKSHQAIVRQIHKAKTKRSRERQKCSHLLQLSA